MNREILFRWRPFEKGMEWKYGHLIKQMFRGKEKFYIGYVQNGAIMGFEVNPLTIGQYTGLKDKNGKKIFEGDIVKGISHKTDSCISKLISSDIVGVVEYHKEYQILEVQSGKVSLHIEVAIKGEVIGNIHDNPELMKGAD